MALALAEARKPGCGGCKPGFPQQASADTGSRGLPVLGIEHGHLTRQATSAYVYGHADPRDAQIAKSLTLDEARRIATSPSWPTLLGKG